MKIRFIVKLVSTRIHHGSKGPKLRKSKSGASSKTDQALANLLLKSQAANNSSGQTLEVANEAGTSSNGASNANNEAVAVDISSVKRKSKDLFTSKVKAYGSHNGNTHVHYLLDETIQDLSPVFDAYKNYVQNVTSKFETFKSEDIRSRKYAYSEARQKVLGKYVEIHGSSVSEEALPEIQRELALYAFDYVKHQIEIQIISDEEIVGGKSYQQEDGTMVYSVTYLSKAVYSMGKGLMANLILKSLEDLSKDVKLDIKTSKAKSGGHIVRDENGRLQLNLDNRLSIVDSGAQPGSSFDF